MKYFEEETVVVLKFYDVDYDRKGTNLMISFRHALYSSGGLVLFENTVAYNLVTLRTENLSETLSSFRFFSTNDT